MQPLSPPTGLLIFKDITFRGFWVSGGCVAARRVWHTWRVRRSGCACQVLVARWCAARVSAAAQVGEEGWSCSARQPAATHSGLLRTGRARPTQVHLRVLGVRGERPSVVVLL
jgi:hypothetical protein